MLAQRSRRDTTATTGCANVDDVACKGDGTSAGALVAAGDLVALSATTAVVVIAAMGSATTCTTTPDWDSAR